MKTTKMNAISYGLINNKSLIFVVQKIPERSIDYVADLQSAVATSNISMFSTEIS